MQRSARSGTTGLTARQEAFARAVAVEGLPLADAYMKTYGTLAASRNTVRTNACKLARHPKVARRIQELYDATAGRSMRPVQALIAELEEAVAADPGELVRVEVDCCPKCWPDATHSREPNPDCSECFGKGDARVAYTSTAEVSPAARRLVRGVECWPDGRVKRLFLHDQTQLRIELHRLRGLHIERSVNLNVNATLPRLKDMDTEQALDYLESLRPTTPTVMAPSADRLPVTVDGEMSTL